MNRPYGFTSSGSNPSFWASSAMGIGVAFWAISRLLSMSPRDDGAGRRSFTCVLVRISASGCGVSMPAGRSRTARLPGACAGKEPTARGEGFGGRTAYRAGAAKGIPTTPPGSRRSAARPELEKAPLELGGEAEVQPVRVTQTGTATPKTRTGASSRRPIGR